MTGTIVTPAPTPENLNDVMEFDHVIHVDATGRVTDHHDATVRAPGLHQDEDEHGVWSEELDTPGWELLKGYTGQHGYAGPMMHASEFIGGRMAHDILSGALPGYYVALYPSCTEHDGTESEPDGWAVAYLPDAN